jgi:hypothetical protein
MKMGWYKKAQNKTVEIQSDLFQESGVNASTDEEIIHRYMNAMKQYGGWGVLTPIWKEPKSEWEISNILFKLRKELDEVKKLHNTEHDNHDPYWRGIRVGLETAINVVLDKTHNSESAIDLINELSDRRWIMAEIGGWNNCMDDERLAKAFLIAQEKLREVHRKHKTWEENGDFGEEEN